MPPPQQNCSAPTGVRVLTGLLETRVLVSLAAVQLRGAVAGAALGAVPGKHGEEEDVEDLEEEAQPGEPEPRGSCVLRHVGGQPGQVNPCKRGA